jgi:outer membrane immunogenic protein
MKRFLMSVVGLVAMLGTGASAADLSRPPPMVTKAPYYAPFYNWTGFSAGVNGGYGWGKSDWSVAGTNFDTRGGLFGGQAGYNWQFGQFVWGVEGDIDWSDMRSSSNLLCGAGGCRTKNEFLSTVRGRVGYAIDRWMPYVTGGLAVGDIKTSVPGFGGVDETKAGWTVGGGVEFALVSNWTAKVEYLHVDLGNTNCDVSCGLPAGNTVGFKSDIVRGGINYRF